jgi:hypothetical protein
MKISYWWGLFLLCSLTASAEPPRQGVPAKPAAEKETAERKAVSAAPEATQRPLPCQTPGAYRKTPTQGTMLWGIAREFKDDERSSLLSSIELGQLQLSGALLRDVQAGSKGLKSVMLKGQSTGAQPVDVALCGGKPAAEDPAMEWYWVEIWSDDIKKWENPCIATTHFPAPRVLAVRGVWDKSGAWRDVPGKVTFACENGVIAKCIQWGYKPWEHTETSPMRDLHQACTRMARADYCGNGMSYTQEDKVIDIYDSLRISTRATASSEGWNVTRGSFEAAWLPEGAACLGHTRDGRPVETLQQECPDRFEARVKDIGQGDVCKWVRRGAEPAAAWLRNHSYGKP